MTKRGYIEIWADGACEPNPGPGAYGVHIVWTNGRITEYDGFDAETTNQRTELIGPSRAYYSNYSFLLAVLGLLTHTRLL